MSKESVEFVTNLMENSPAGPIMNTFVLQAIELFAREVIRRQEELPENPLISRKAWVSCAEHALQAFTDRAVDVQGELVQ